MIIQNEYCDGMISHYHKKHSTLAKILNDVVLIQSLCASGGSVNDAIVKKEVQGELFSEAELKDLLLQVSMGLKYIHSLGLVHLDIKPSMSH